jgi:multiple sugar transport system ATP-binding protein
MATIDLVGVTKRFGPVTACHNIHLQVADGEFVTLLGPSGCGKTTLLNLIAGLEEVTSGEIRIGNRVVNSLSPFARDVAMVFQNYALYPNMTVAENIGFSLRLRKLPTAEIRQQVAQVAQMLELTPLLHRLPRELSGGQQQRVAIGRAVIRQPVVFLFDEPFSNLDAALRVRLRGEVKELHQRLKVTSIFVTHDQEEALSLSDRIAVFQAGRVEQFGTPEEVYARPANTYVARFIGSPQMDLWAGEVVREPGLDGVERVAYGVGAVSFGLPPDRVFPTGAIDLGVRPEHISLGAAGVPVIVRLVQPVGPFTYVTVEWQGGSATARLHGMARLRPQEQVFMQLDPAGLLWFDRATGKRIE